MGPQRLVGWLFVAAVCTVAGAQVAEAAFHLMQIEQVIGGVNGNTSAQAIQLRMRSAGQNVLGGARMRVFDAAGLNPIIVVNFAANVPNGATGARVLISTSDFNASTSPTAVPNFAMTAIPPSYLAAGSLTFETDTGFVYWRLSWGGASYTGPTTGAIDNDADGQYGPPYPNALPSTTLQALQFQGTASAPSTNNAANYTLTAGAAVFVNNAGASFTVIAPGPTGACCNDSTGVCSENLSQVTCEGSSRRYGGDSSTCGTISPPCQPHGACCDEMNGTCANNQTPTACGVIGGTYGGDGSDCATMTSCPTDIGACCHDDVGDCSESITQGLCETNGGRFGGEASTCDNMDPPCEVSELQTLLVPVAGTGVGRSAGTTLVAPIHVTHAGDASDRLFIVDQSGVIRIVDAGGNLLPTPFLDVTAKLPMLGDLFDERGLLGMAFHPDYETNGRFFIRYSAPRASTGSEPCDVTTFNPGCHKEVLAEYAVSGDPNVADPDSERVLFEVDEPQFNHNAGMVEFGPDGYLYFTLGDGGGANDGLADGDPPGSAPSHGPIGNGQNIDTALGSLLRIDVDGPPDVGLEYAIPPDNPFVDADGLDEIYAYGFRNPFRFSFDDGPGGTGELYLADVGQDIYEEVDIVTLGGNYGWVIREGFECFDPFNPGVPPKSCPTTGAMGEPLLDPVSVYTHAEGGLAILGGYVYRGSEFPELVGRYVYGDFSGDFFNPTGRLYYFDTTGLNAYVRREFIVNPDESPLGLYLKGLGRDEAGELYVCASSDLAPSGTSGVVFKMVRPPASPRFEPGGPDYNRFAAFVIPPTPMAARSGPAQMTALRVELTTLNHPRFCCDPASCDAAGLCSSCSGTTCNVNAHCTAEPNTHCGHGAAAGMPDFSALEGRVRYVNSFGVGKCCDPASVGEGSCNFAANCTGDGDCVPPNAPPPFTSCNRLICQDDGPSLNTSYKCATLGCEPDYRDWSAELATAGPGQPDVAGLLFVTGDAVVPSSTLSISHIAADCGLAPAANTCLLSSVHLLAGTAKWGDITGAAFSPPDGKSDVLDVPAVINKLKSIPTGHPTNPFPEYRLWLKQRDPVPNTDAITVIELSDVVDAGPQAKVYPASRTIDPCPHD